jgi:hypothetical protein
VQGVGDSDLAPGEVILYHLQICVRLLLRLKSVSLYNRPTFPEHLCLTQEHHPMLHNSDLAKLHPSALQLLPISHVSIYGEIRS